MALRDHRFLKGNRSQIAGQNLLQDSEKKLKIGTEYDFLTGVVKDVVSNPYEYLGRNFLDTEFTYRDVLTGKVSPEVDSGSGVKKYDLSSSIENPELIESMPINSVFAYIVDENKGIDTGRYVVCYPFFPPHLSLPMKPGEYVWIITEKIGSLNYYYWMCRKVAPIEIDDVNFTNYERISAVNDIANAYKDNNQLDLDMKDCYSIDERRQGSVFNRTKGQARGSNLPEPLELLFDASLAFKQEFTGEPVPRLSKGCGDLLLQSSNNAGIQLTTEKFESSFIDPEKYYLGFSDASSLKPDSAAIDLFVGRKKDARSQIAYSGRGALRDNKRDPSGKMNFAANNSQNGKYDFIENDKLANIRKNSPDVYKEELNDTIDDALDVAARIYLSHNCEVDSAFGSSFDVLSSHVGEAVVTYSDINRVVGNKSTRIVSRQGESFIDMDTEGNVVIKSSIADGQQFLSLSNNGITRLQARDKIEITQSTNNSDVPELVIEDGNTTITGGDIDISGDNTSITASEMSYIRLLVEKEMGIEAKSISGKAGPLLAVGPIKDFIEYWKNLPATQKLQVASTTPPLSAISTALLPAGGAVTVVAAIDVAIPVLEIIIENLATKYLMGE
jgi:hypothetical protein